MRNRLLLLALLLSLASCAPAPPVVSRPQLHTLGGELTDLARVSKGRVTLVALWATWCDSCKRELGALSRLDARTKQRGDAVVVAIAVGDTKEDVAIFAKEHHLAYEMIVDEDFALADWLGERRVPTTLVLNREGRIVYRGNALDGEALAALRRELETP